VAPVPVPFQTTMRVPPVPRSWGPGIAQTPLGQELLLINVRSLSGLPRRDKGGLSEDSWPGQFR